MKEFVCITCPNSCRMQAELENGQWKVTGNKCKRGQQFAESEMTCPKRTFSTTVKTAWDSVPVIPVRVSREIPKINFSDYGRNQSYDGQKIHGKGRCSYS